MTTLLLRLAGPMQAWGDSSRFTRRETRTEPTKSAVIGLLAAAQGRRRTDPIEDLLALRFGVRVDQIGELGRDFQTAQHWATGRRMPLSYRYFLSDAVFVAGLEGPAELTDALAAALTSPAFPIYLGRRSFPPSKAVLLGLSDADLVTALTDHDWEASDWYRRRQPRHVSLRLVVDGDVLPGASVSETVRDVPRSFDPVRREYTWRDIAELPGGVEKANDVGRIMESAGPDFFREVTAP
ncbi:MAG: type I-E CRISPR-associated protein Cas5/CasD [Actinobacteria bacterium]|nr:type I-E CRISPR-associated protein Cas5/CasD [Actinomycetota bacterium]